MKAKYKKAIWSYKGRRDNDSLQLNTRNINHLNKIYQQHNIEPESLECVTVEFLLQRENLARYIIKELDILLAVGGLFEVILMDNKAHSSYARSRDQVKYEMSLSTNGRYKQIKVEKLQNEKVLKITYQKIRATLPEDDSIEKWSFGIITNGKKTDLVESLISTILRQNIPHYEIIICGPFDNHAQHANLIVLDDVVLEDDIRAPVCAKKNKIIASAKYNNVCILHDRFSLPSDWYVKFKAYGNLFDYLCLPTQDESGQRFTVDWMKFSDQITQTCSTQNRSMAYSEWSPSQIIQGGVILGKKHLMTQHMLDERLHWEELEDMQFSKIAYLNGAFITTDIANCFISKSVNHKSVRYIAGYSELKVKYYWLRGLCSTFLKFHYYLKQYDKLTLSSGDAHD